MKNLDDIPTFPARLVTTLSKTLGIDTAETFFGHAVQDPAGMRQALDVSAEELDRLVRLAEGYLDPEFATRCRQPVTKHPRGVIVETRHRPKKK